MGAKQKGSSKPKGNQAEEVEETLQAVVLADTFETRFEPFTLDKPRVCTRRKVTEGLQVLTGFNHDSVFFPWPTPPSSNIPSSFWPMQVSRRFSSTEAPTLTS